ncbi:MAG TPA: hypothetical protein VK879_09735 [Candidatus Sulfomarinibacteraceae bacterium]|nr:hypothetical protein [Candidatus Sulfomarinibacteraceae bacterium]
MKDRKLIAILIVSVLLRIAAAFYMGNTVVPLPGAFDQVSYHTLALRVLDGHGFTFGQTWWPATAAGEPTAHWSYLYTAYLVAVYALFGAQPLIARIIQATLVGLLQPYLAYRLARQLFDAHPHDQTTTAPGWSRWLQDHLPHLAAAITAGYIYFIYYAAALMTEPFYFVAILASLTLTVSLARRREGHNRLAVMLGLALAAAILLRQLYLLFIPFLFLWLILAHYRQRRWTDSLRPIAISVGLVVLTILPITAFNYSRFDRFVLLNTNAGFAFYLANHPFYEDTFIPASEMDSYRELIPDELRHLNEAALDQALLQRGLQFVVDEPGRYLRLSLSRIPEYFRFWPQSASGMLSNVSRLLSFGLFLPFMLIGVARQLALRVRQARRSLLATIISPGALLLFFILVYTGIHILSWTQVRYRLPVDAVLVLFAAQGVAAAATVVGRLALTRRRQAGRHKAEPADPISS